MSERMPSETKTLVQTLDAEAANDERSPGMSATNVTRAPDLSAAYAALFADKRPRPCTLAASAIYSLSSLLLYEGLDGPPREHAPTRALGRRLHDTLEDLLPRGDGAVRLRAVLRLSDAPDRVVELRLSDLWLLIRAVQGAGRQRGFARTLRGQALLQCARALCDLFADPAIPRVLYDTLCAGWDGPAPPMDGAHP